jgi:hypothetical protein
MELDIILNYLLQQLVSDHFYLENLNCVVGLKAVACVALVCTAADEIKIAVFF